MNNLTQEQLIENLAIRMSKVKSPEDMQRECTHFIKEYIRVKNTPRDYNHETTNQKAKRLRAIEQKDLEVRFWREVVKELDGVNIRRYYDALDALLIDRGFKK